MQIWSRAQVQPHIHINQLWSMDFHLYHGTGWLKELNFRQHSVYTQSSRGCDILISISQLMRSTYLRISRINSESWESLYVPQVLFEVVQYVQHSVIVELHTSHSHGRYLLFLFSSPQYARRNRDNRLLGIHLRRMRRGLLSSPRPLNRHDWCQRGGEHDSVKRQLHTSPEYILTWDQRSNM